MNKPDKTLNSDALMVLTAFTVRELLSTLRQNDIINKIQAEEALTRAAQHLERSTVGRSEEELNDLVSFLLGYDFALPKKHLN